MDVVADASGFDDEGASAGPQSRCRAGRRSRLSVAAVGVGRTLILEAAAFDRRPAQGLRRLPWKAPPASVRWLSAWAGYLLNQLLRSR